MKENSLPKNFDEQLLAAQRVNESLRQKYEREVQAMFEKKLSGTNKLLYISVGVLSVALTIGFAIAAVAARKLPWEAPAGFALGTVFSAGWALLLFRALRRGRIDLRFDEKAQAGLVWVFIVFMITLLMLMAGRHPDSVRGVGMVVNGIVFLIGAVVFMLQTGINQSRMKIEERLLEVQLKIAELTEAIKNENRRA